MTSSCCFVVFAQDSPPNAPVSHDEVVFLVHGLGRKKQALSTIATNLKGNSRFEVILLQYPSREGNFDYQVAYLRQQIAPYLQSPSRNRYHFVGHSLGAVLSWILWKDIPKDRQGRLIMLGAPLQGSPWLEEGWIRKEILEPFYGAILPDLYDIPQLLRRYEIDLQDPNNKIEIAGNICPWYVNAMGITHYLDRPHDCFVTVHSALAFASEKKVLCPVSHEGLLSETCPIENILQWLETDAPAVLL
jgi:pimeloyl-ACP methyl ester carboxylesterase